MRGISKFLLFSLKLTKETLKYVVYKVILENNVNNYQAVGLLSCWTNTINMHLKLQRSRSHTSKAQMILVNQLTNLNKNHVKGGGGPGIYL